LTKLMRKGGGGTILFSMRREPLKSPVSTPVPHSICTICEGETGPNHGLKIYRQWKPENLMRPNHVEIFYMLLGILSPHNNGDAVRGAA
jgi:hypothetical protein